MNYMWPLEHWHTLVVIGTAVVVGLFLIFRHGAALLPGRSHTPSEGASAANEFLLVSILILLIGLAARIEQVSSEIGGSLDKEAKASGLSDENVKLISEKLDRIAGTVPASHQIEVLQGYDKFVRTIEKEVINTNERWLVTRFQRQQATSRQEDAYFAAMMARVRNEQIRDCRRMVRIGIRDHLDRYIKMMNELGKVPYFGMAVWKPEEPPFDFELLIGDEVVILAYGGGAPTWSVAIRDRSIADRFATTFDVMWRSDSTEIIKSINPLTDEGIQNAIARMEEVYSGKPKVSSNPGDSVKGIPETPQLPAQ